MQHIVQNLEVNYSASVKTFADFVFFIQFQKPEILDFNFCLEWINRIELTPYIK